MMQTSTFASIWLVFTPFIHIEEVIVTKTSTTSIKINAKFYENSSVIDFLKSKNTLFLTYTILSLHWIEDDW